MELFNGTTIGKYEAIWDSPLSMEVFHGKAIGKP
jgi:hypothetical protein